MQCYPLGSSYLVGRVLSIDLQNSLSLTMVPFLIYFLCFSSWGVTFPLVVLDKTDTRTNQFINIAVFSLVEPL